MSAPRLRVATTADARAYDAAERRAIEGEAPRAPSTPREVLARLAAQGPAVHVPTGIAPLDELTRGGPRLGDLVVVLGAPSVAKTMLATILADTWAERACVGVYAIDEDDEGIVTRLAQRRDWDRGGVERRENFAALAARMPALWIYDAGWSLAAVIEDLAARAGDRPVILVADSLQAIAEATATDDETQTRAVARTLAALRTAAVSRRWLVVVTSEMARAAYSGQDRTGTLAAGKWSGSIEYAAKVLLGMQSVPDESDLVRVEVAKCKPGREGELYLRIDRASQRIEVAEAPERAAGDESAAGHEQITRDAATVARAVADAQGASTGRIYADAQSLAGTMSRDRYGAARARLRRAGALVVVAGPNRSERLYLAGPHVPPEVLDEVSLDERPRVASAVPPAPTAAPPPERRTRRRRARSGGARA